MTRAFVLLLACACGAVLAAPADAQLSGASLEATLGYSAGGGSYGERGGIALDLLLSRPVRETPAGTLVAALSAGVHGPIAGDLSCVNDPVGGGCLPNFPVFISAGAMAGVQRGSSGGASARLLAGPALFVADEGEGGPGLQGRLDAATAPLFHVSLVAMLQAAVLPRFHGDALTVGSFGLGLRIQ